MIVSQVARQLASPTFRTIPVRVADLPRVVSYSDGEGDDAGVGVAIWFPGQHCPEAGQKKATNLDPKWHEEEEAKKIKHKTPQGEGGQRGNSRGCNILGEMS